MKTGAAGVAVLLVAACGPFGTLGGSATVDRICKTDENRTIPGGTTDASVLVPFTLGKDLEELTRHGLTGQLVFTDVTLQPRSGVTSLEFIEEARMAFLDNAVPPGEIEVVHYVRARGPVPLIQATAEHSPNLLGGLQDGTLTARVSMSGTLPSSGFSVDVQACFRAHADG